MSHPHPLLSIFRHGLQHQNCSIGKPVIGDEREAQAYRGGGLRGDGQAGEDRGEVEDRAQIHR